MRKLHIGGKLKCEGWEVLNANPAPYVDYVCNANDLSQFENDTFDQLYASHVLEHFDFRDELPMTLREWNRVLVPGGTVFISVPDLDALSGLLLEKERLRAEERYFVMRMLFGGLKDRYDYHMVGLNLDFLTHFLVNSGFINIQQVKDFGIFADTSLMIYKGVSISLNMIAEKRRA